MIRRNINEESSAIVFDFTDIHKPIPYHYIVKNGRLFLSIPCHGWVEITLHRISEDGLLLNNNMEPGSVQCPEKGNSCFHDFVFLDPPPNVDDLKFIPHSHD